MKRTFLPRLSIAIIIILISIECYSANITLQSTALPDSIQKLLSECNTDTCQFRILSNLFWQYAEADIAKRSFVGEQAFEVIKNSSNIRKRADGYYIKGLISRDNGENDSAIVCFEKSLSLAESKNYKSRIAWSYFQLASVNVTIGEPDKVIAYSQKGIQTITRIEIPKLIYKFNFMISNAYKALNNFDSALVYLNRCLETSRLQNDKASEISAYLQISGFYKSQNNNQKTIENMLLAINLADSYKNDEIAGYVYSEIGVFFSAYKNSFDIALDYYNKGLEKCQLSDDKYQKAFLLSSICKLYSENGNDSMALVFNTKCYEQALKLKHRHHISNAYKGYGLIYNKQKKYKLAIENYIKCFETGCTMCPKISFHDALVATADINMKLNNLDGAYQYYLQAHELAEKFNAKPELALTKLKLGNYYSQTRQLQLAENAYLSSFKIAQEAQQIKLIKDISDTLSHFYYKQKNFIEAFNYKHITLLMTDSLNAMDSKTAMSDLQMKFEFEKVKKETDARELIAKHEIKQQKIYRNSFLVMSGLLALFGFLIFINYKRKHKDNILLQAQKSEIETISKQLHESDQAKLRFFANISHELRTPLTLIVSPLAKLLKENTNETTNGLYSVMLRNSKKLQHMINQLLDISKINKHELKLNLKPYDFTKQVSLAVAMFQSVADENNIEFKLTQTTNNMVFGFDAERMEQIISNLLSNAFKFTPRDGKIEVVISAENNNAILKISDTGIGIPPESIDKVFDRFYQSQASINRYYEGSGIGLALVKEFVELHHGSVYVNSELDKWTEFTVAIPMVQIENMVAIEEYNTVSLIENTFRDELPENNEIKKNRNTILLVEDNNDLRLYISNILSAQNNVIEASNGTEGIELATKHIPDIIISDVMMPETDGYQLTSKIKGNIETSHIPIILLTAKAGRESKIEGLERGADDYLNKPFDEEELLLKVKNILSNRQKLQEKYRKQISPKPSDLSEPSMDEQFIAKLIDLIEKDMSDTSLDVDSLSTSIGLSRQQLYRKLKAITGITPVEFIRSIRIKRAAQLLKQNTASISEIAYMSGFETPSYFSKCFKDELGIIPSEYANSGK